MSTLDAPLFVQTPQPDGAEIAAKLVSLFSFSALAFLFGIKTFNVKFRFLTYSRWLVLILYVLTWTFTAISMLLVTTNNANFTSCFLSIIICDIFYSATKIVAYGWLVEKVYVVNSSRESRWNTLSYKLHILLMLPYIAILTLMLVFHTAEVELDGTCIIGLQTIAALPLLIYDFLINLYMTIYFIRPLIKMSRSSVRNIIRRKSRLNEVAFRTLIASIVSLVVSFANIFTLQILHGRERGLVCLTCCTVDVTVNVITIHWVTSQTGSRIKDSQLDASIFQLDSSPDQLLGVVNNEATPIQHKTAGSSKNSGTDDHADSMLSFMEEPQNTRKSLTRN